MSRWVRPLLLVTSRTTLPTRGASSTLSPLARRTQACAFNRSSSSATERTTEEITPDDSLPWPVSSPWINVKEELRKPQQKPILPTEDIPVRPQWEPGSEIDDAFQLAALRLAKDHGFDSDVVMSILRGRQITWPPTTWDKIAPSFIGLHPTSGLNDVPSFELHPTRMSDSLFGAILEAAENERSRDAGPPITDKSLLELIIKYTATQFKTKFTKGPQFDLADIFRSCGGLAVVGVHVVEKPADSLAVMTNIVSHSAVFSYANKALGAINSPPIYSIFFDGDSVEFFRLDYSGAFTRGLLCIEGNPPDSGQRRLPLAGLKPASRADFAVGLRLICDAVFSVFLRGYCDAFAACAEWATLQSKGKLQPFVFSEYVSFSALHRAELASQRAASGEIDFASFLANKAFGHLVDSIDGRGPIGDRAKLFPGWNGW